MINLLKYRPVVNVRDRGIYYSAHGERFTYDPILIHKDTFDRIQRYTKPIESMLDYNMARIDLEAQMYLKIEDLKKGSLDDLGIEVSDRYKGLLKKVREEWKERLDAGGGYMLFQYNAKVGIFGDSYARLVQESPSEVTGAAPEFVPKKITYLRYFLFEVPVCLAIKSYCSFLNFINRKKIKKSQEEALVQLHDFRMGLLEKKNEKSN